MRCPASAWRWKQAPKPPIRPATSLAKVVVKWRKEMPMEVGQSATHEVKIHGQTFRIPLWLKVFWIHLWQWRLRSQQHPNNIWSIISIDSFSKRLQPPSTAISRKSILDADGFLLTRAPIFGRDSQDPLAMLLDASKKIPCIPRLIIGHTNSKFWLICLECDQHGIYQNIMSFRCDGWSLHHALVGLNQWRWNMHPSNATRFRFIWRCAHEQLAITWVSWQSSWRYSSPACLECTARTIRNFRKESIDYSVYWLMG